MSPATLEQLRQNVEKNSAKIRRKHPPHATEGSEDMIKSHLMFQKHYQVTLMVALTTLSTIGIMSYLGHLLDVWLGFKAAFVIVGLLLSFPVSQIILYKWIKERYIPQVKQISKNLKETTQK